MNDATDESARGQMGWGPVSVSLGTIVLGLALILASLLPLGELTQDALWTDDDSTAFDRASQEYHRLSYQSPQRAGLSEDQLTTQIEKARMHFESLRDKLQYAREQPLAWRRTLLWTGVVLTACGGLGRFASRRG